MFCSFFFLRFSSEGDNSTHVKIPNLGLDMVFGMESLVSATQVSKVDEHGVGRLGNWGIRGIRGETWEDPLGVVGGAAMCSHPPLSNHTGRCDGDHGVVIFPSLLFPREPVL